MSEENRDPSGNTEAFRAFVQRDEPAPPARSNNTPLIVAGVAVGVVLVVVFVAILVLR
jgi:hypothetical protein